MKNLIERVFPVYSKSLSPNIFTAVTADSAQADKVMFILTLMQWGLATSLAGYQFGTYGMGFWGGALISLQAWVAFRFFQGRTLGRALHGSCQYLFTALYIQQNFGQIEMHFHFFMSLGVLMRYKDIVPLLICVVSGATHHFLFNFCQSQGMKLPFTDIPIVLFNYGHGWDIVALHSAVCVIVLMVYGYLITDSFHKFKTNLETKRRSAPAMKNCKRKPMQKRPSSTTLHTSCERR
jgi:methyl-accepting chemotaxis protein